MTPNFIFTSTQNPPLILDEEAAVLKIFSLKQTTPILLGQSAAASSVLLTQKMDKVSALQQRFPKLGNVIFETFLDIFQKAKTKKNSFLSQMVQISFLKNACNYPPSDIENAKKLCQIIQSEISKANLPLVKTTLSRLAKSYQQQTSDLSFAQELKKTALACLKKKGTPSVGESKWLNEIATILCQKHPTPEFQDFKSKFQPKVRYPYSNKEKLPLEAPVAYPIRAAVSFKRGPRGYDFN